MAVRLTMPRLGLTMQAGTIVQWYKAEDDAVKPGEPLFAVEIDKSVQDYQSPGSGLFKLAQGVAGQPLPLDIPVEGVIGYLLQPGESAPDGGSAGTSVGPLAPTAPAPVAVAAGVPDRKPYRASPLARRMAREVGIDLMTITPAEGDTIHQKDVEAAVAAREAARLAAPATISARVPAASLAVGPMPAPPTTPESGKSDPMNSVRRTIARRMAEAAHTTAAITLVTEADATALVDFREQAKASLEAASRPVPTYTDIIVRIAALALQEHPDLNATLVGDEILRISEVHIAVAVDTEHGLLVPVIRDVLRKTLEEITLEAGALAEKARERKLGPDDQQGGTFTVTNLGNFGIDAFTPIINLPQCAILGVGRILGKPAEYRGELALRKMVTLSLTVDHRVVDGAPAARFLDRIRQYVEDPFLWLTR